MLSREIPIPTIENISCYFMVHMHVQNYHQYHSILTQTKYNSRHKKIIKCTYRLVEASNYQYTYDSCLNRLFVDKFCYTKRSNNFNCLDRLCNLVNTRNNWLKDQRFN
jgi:hypothetical protein